MDKFKLLTGTMFEVLLEMERGQDMTTILIVEDDIQQSTNLKKMLLELDENLNIYEAQSKKTALEISNKVYIDIFYVDITLTDGTGIDFAKELRKIQKYELNWIVFITTHVQYMMEAFKEIHCYDYVLKPYEKKDIFDLTRKLISGKYVKDQLKGENNQVVFKLKSGINIKINVEEIVFIEAVSRSCIVHTKNGKYELKGVSLKKVLELIAYPHIMQSSKAFLVNIKHIKKIESLYSKLSKIYFKDYNENALLGYKFKNILLEKFKLIDSERSG